MATIFNLSNPNCGFIAYHICRYFNPPCKISMFYLQKKKNLFLEYIIGKIYHIRIRGCYSTLFVPSAKKSDITITPLTYHLLFRIDKTFIYDFIATT